MAKKPKWSVFLLAFFWSMFQKWVLKGHGFPEHLLSEAEGCRNYF